VLKLRRSRTARIAGQAAVLVALVGGTAAYAANDTTVQLSVDGQAEDVRVFGTTVDDVLDVADVDVTGRDLVAPALDEQIEDGDKVVVRHARLLTLTVDGKTEKHWTTALTVDEALADLNVRAEGARLSASRSTPLGRSGLSLQIVTPKNVAVVADGKTTPLTTTAPTAGVLLNEAGVNPDADDRVSLPLEAPVNEGLTVQVVRVATQQVVETAAVPPGTQNVESGELYTGETRVQSAGQPGEHVVTYNVTTADGMEESRVPVSDVVTRQPVARVVLVGTKARPAAAPARASAPAAPVASGSVWDRLAQCEAGGNWSINTGNGYYGGLQFSAGSWHAMGGSGLPHQASRETQIAMGERLLAAQGWGAWPSCSRQLGLR
jgi:resuscitation-promoting factor RpfB